jgi:hypothetical protein
MAVGEFPPPTPDKPSFWDRFAAFALAATMAIAGIVILVVSTPCGGAANPAFQMLAGACFGASFEVFSQALSGKGISELNWLKVGVGALSGALSALPIGGALGYVVAGLVGGGTDALMTAIDGGSLEDCIKAFAVGALKAIAIRGATQLLGKVTSRVKANEPGGCFVAGTAVLALGGAVAIENIRKGDMVLSRNDTLVITEYKPVTDIYVYHDITKLTRVQYSDGDEIIATPKHPFYVFNRGYVEAGNLRAGDILLLSNGKTVVVEKIQHEILERPTTVYNIEVADNHNYYVASNLIINTEFVLVHNATCGPDAPVTLKDSYLTQNGIDPHSFKAEFVGPKNISKYNIVLDKADDMLWLQRIHPNSNADKWIETLVKFIRR